MRTLIAHTPFGSPETYHHASKPTEIPLSNNNIRTKDEGGRERERGDEGGEEREREYFIFGRKNRRIF
jgi:hypothetical protein